MAFLNFTLCQGLKACPGRRQRHGVNGKLECHLLDLDCLDHLDIPTLRRFISVDSEILSRKSTGLCAKCQRKVGTDPMLNR
jgi:ribosomal protein S18